MSSNKIIFKNDENLNKIELDIINYSNKLIKSLNVPKNTDLISGKYEGGIKIWECALDLIQFLPKIYSKSNLTNFNVLELGCGHGLPGIYFLLKKSNVTFQDFNKEVLENITKNYIIQLKDKYNLDYLKNVDFISGDWKEFKSNKKFNIIVSGDTLYNIDNYEKIFNILYNYLEKNGVAYFSTKKFYYGVGGSSSEFIYFIESKNCFEINKINEINDGISNIRLILEIKWKK